MAIGRTFPESLQKGLRSLESGPLGLRSRTIPVFVDLPDDELERACRRPTPDRLFAVAARARPRHPDRAAARDHGDRPLVPATRWPRSSRPTIEFASTTSVRRRPRPAGLAGGEAAGFGDAQLAQLWERRTRSGAPRRASPPASTITYKTVDTCAAEFEAATPYHYGTYEDDCEVTPLDQSRGGHPRQRPQPHRPGRRVRLLLCARRVRALRRGLRDGDGQLQPRDRLHRLRHERPALLRAALGRRRAQRVRSAAPRTASCGGHRRTRRSDAAEARPHAGRAAGIPVVGTSPDSIDLAEDRDRFNALCDELGIPQPAGGTARASTEPRRSRPRSATRCSSGPPTSWAGVRCRSCSTAKDWSRHGGARHRRLARARRGTLGGATRAHRPVPGGRHRGRRRRAPRPHRRGLDRRDHGAHRGSRGALGRQRLRAAPLHVRGRA